MGVAKDGRWTGDVAKEWTRRRLRQMLGIKSPSRNLTDAFDRDSYGVALRAYEGTLRIDSGFGQGSGEDSSRGEDSGSEEHCPGCIPGPSMLVVMRGRRAYCPDCRRDVTHMMAPAASISFVRSDDESMRDDDNLRDEEALEDLDEKQEVDADSRALDAINSEGYELRADDSPVTRVTNRWVEVGGQFGGVDFAVRLDEGLSWEQVVALQNKFLELGASVGTAEGFLMGWWSGSPNYPGSPGSGG